MQLTHKHSPRPLYGTESRLCGQSKKPSRECKVDMVTLRIFQKIQHHIAVWTGLSWALPEGGGDG